MTKLIFSMLILTSSLASASATLLDCRDFKGRTLFSGVVRTNTILPEGEGEGARIVFDQAVSDEPVMILDRVTLQRKIGLTLPNCNGPYARVYARLGKGELPCEGLKVSKSVDVKWTDANILGLLLPKSEVACAITLPPPALKNLK